MRTRDYRHDTVDSITRDIPPVHVLMCTVGARASHSGVVLELIYVYELPNTYMFSVLALFYFRFVAMSSVPM